MSDSSDSTTFSITDSQINFAGVLAMASTIPGTCVCFLVLVGYAIAASYNAGRKQLDRVSFRLLAQAMVWNIFFGIAYAATPTAPGPGCNVGAFFVNVTLAFTTFLTTCIAINLYLVLVHNISGARMEKFYILGVTVLTIILNVPTFALHHFGWDEDSATCWYKSTDSQSRLRWIIGTQSFWNTLAATIETVCSVVVLIYIYRTTRRVTNLGLRSQSTTTTIVQDPKYRNIIIRIALYPIVSLIINFTTVGLDLKVTIHGMNTQNDFRLLVTDLVFYGLRTLAYGLLAAFDPAFISAIKAIRKEKSIKGSSDGSKTMPTRANAMFGSVSGRETVSTVPQLSDLSSVEEQEKTSSSTMLPEEESQTRDLARQL